MPDLVITPHWHCARCGKHALSQSYRVVEGAALPVSSLPTGWIEFDGGYLCDEHEVLFRDEDPEKVGVHLAAPMGRFAKAEYDEDGNFVSRIPSGRGDHCA